MTLTRSLVTLIGTATYGPLGGLLGGVVGSLLESVSPSIADIAKNIAGNLGSNAAEQIGSQIIKQIMPGTTKFINHDLQTAFRDAFGFALYDIGGQPCFPDAWRSPRNVPKGVNYAQTSEGNQLWHTGNPLADQVNACLHHLEEALHAQRLLPLDPPDDLHAANVNTYLFGTSLDKSFFDEIVAPHLTDYTVFFIELPEFEKHLRRHIVDRTLVHLGELLKERTPAWRAFNRQMLEDLRDEIHTIKVEQLSLHQGMEHFRNGQAQIVDQLNTLIDQINADPEGRWDTCLAEIVTKVGAAQKTTDYHLTTVLDRILIENHGLVEQLQQTLAVLTQLVNTTGRIEEKINFLLERQGDQIVRRDAPPISLTTAPAKPHARSPYQGLQYFDTADADRFFGRENLVATLVERLSSRANGTTGQAQSHQFLAVVGASGSGKSSLVRAGLIPAFQHGVGLAYGQQPPSGSTSWPICVVTPTDRPLETLAAALTRNVESVTAAAALAEDMRHDSRSLVIATDRIVSGKPATSRLLLVIDQFEEVFTLCKDETARKAFIDNLLRAVSSSSRILVVITLRSDFYDACAPYAELREMLPQHQIYIGQMSDDELRHAIEKPAIREGWIIEPVLVELLIHDVANEPGALPLLSHALVETWKRRRGYTMMVESYQESGMVRGAIAQTAETVYNGQLTTDQQAIARRIFLRLTEIGETGTKDTRRRERLDALIPRSEEEEQVRAVLKVLDHARLLTFGSEEQQAKVVGGHPNTRGLTSSFVEVAHEALIREWPTLRRWLDEGRTRLLVQKHLMESAEDWEQRGHAVEDVYRGARLAAGLELLAGNPDEIYPREHAFLEASQRAAKTEEDQKLAQATALAEAQTQRAEAEQQKAEEQRLRAEAEQQKAEEQRLRAEAEQQKAEEQQRRADAEQQMAEVEKQKAEMQIVASRKLKRRARFLTGAVIGTVMVTLLACVLGALSLLFGYQANQASIRQAQEARRALANEVANKSVSFASTEPDRALLLSLEAGQIGNSSEITRSLLTGLTSNPALNYYMRGHTDWVYSAAFSPTSPTSDTNTLASGSEDGSVILWDSAGGSPIAIFNNNQGAVRSVTWSPAGRTLAAGIDNGTLIVRSFATYRRASGMTAVDYTSPPVATTTFTDHTKTIRSVIFDKSGKLIVSGGEDGRIVLRNLATQQTQVLTDTKGTVYGLAFSGDGTMLVSTNYSEVQGTSKVQLWKVNDDRITFDRTIPRDEQDTGSIFSIALSPDSHTIAWGSSNGNLWLYDIKKNEVRTPRNKHGGQILGVAFSPDSKTVATAGGDRVVMLWDTESVQRNDVLTGHSSVVWSIAFSPDGNKLLSTSADQSLISWNVQMPYVLSTNFAFGNTSLWSVAASEDSKLLAAGDSEGSIYLYNYPARDIRHFWQKVAENARGEGHTKGVLDLAFSADSTMLASVSFDTTLKIWNTSNFDLIRSIPSQHGNIRSIAFHPTTSMLMAGCSDGTILVIDASTGKILRTLTHYKDSSVLSVAFSADGKWAASGATDNRIILWNVVGGWKSEPIPADATNWVYSVAFSPNSKLLAAGTSDGGLIVWDILSHTLHQPQTWKHGGIIRDLTFSSDSAMMISGGDDGKIILWDVDTLQPLGPPIREHTDAILGLATLTNGSIIASVSTDASIRAWKISRNDWKVRACTIANRNLTAYELKIFLPGQLDHTICLIAHLNQANIDALRGNAKAKSAFADLAKQASVIKDEQLNNNICWLGSLNNFADVVMASCVAAVNETGFPLENRDSRGLAFALTGHLEEAKRDFEAFVVWANSTGWYEGRRREREEWIKELAAGRNPFDAATLRRLRNE